MKFLIQTSHVIFIVHGAINYPWYQQSVNKALATGWGVCVFVSEHTPTVLMVTNSARFVSIAAG